jgi:hypothetical protein
MARTVLNTESGDKIIIFYGKSGKQIIDDLRWFKKERKVWGNRNRVSFPTEYSLKFDLGSKGLGKYVNENGDNVFYFGVYVHENMTVAEANTTAKELIQSFCARSGLRAPLNEAIDLLNQSPLTFPEPRSGRKKKDE